MSKNLENVRNLLGQLGLSKDAVQSDTVEEVEDPRDDTATPGPFSTELDSTLESSSEGSTTEKGQESPAEQNINTDNAENLSDASLITEAPAIESSSASETEMTEDVEGDGKGGTSSGITVQDAVKSASSDLSTLSDADIIASAKVIRDSLTQKKSASTEVTEEEGILALKKQAGSVLTKIAQDASDSADLVAGYLTGLQEKAAEDMSQELAVNEAEKEQGEESMEGEDDGAGLLEAMQAQSAPEGELPPEGAPLEEMLPPMGGGEEMGMPAVIPPEGADAGLPPEEALMDPQTSADLGALGPEGAIQELASALVELGIPPEELVAAADSQQAEPAKMAYAVQQYKRAGLYQNTSPSPNSPQRRVRDYMKAVVTEYCPQ